MKDVDVLLVPYDSGRYRREGGAGSDAAAGGGGGEPALQGRSGGYEAQEIADPRGVRRGNPDGVRDCARRSPEGA